MTVLVFYESLLVRMNVREAVFFPACAALINPVIVLRSIPAFVFVLLRARLVCLRFFFHFRTSFIHRA